MASVATATTAVGPVTTPAVSVEWVEAAEWVDMLEAIELFDSTDVPLGLQGVLLVLHLLLNGEH